MKINKLNFIYSILLLFLVSCESGIQKGNELSKSDLNYIIELGLLNKNEKIILFSSQGGNKMSGNFISEKRLASYWIENREENNQINSAEFIAIDTLITKNLSESLTYASYIKVVKKDSSEFKVYIDGKPEEINKFFKRAILEWKNRNK
ncbi:hypothetical protein [Polaribacter vadi]|uniref:Lipoprotein n=1 Tax=Polaribacter vadi TaxID=1774273 RepID=A0A1B8U2B1_9FLAO|nr:hypothetical protein [Polaribacter vadi]OBY65982.1 hypothetical protein LPB3_02130 [Polaribacter vadi]